MKILIVDQTGFQLQTRKMLIEDAIHRSEVETISTLGELFIVFQKDKYDVIIIDHSVENGQQCADYILKTAPNQSLLVVSNAIQCVLNRCEDCVNNHLVRRLYNPTPIKNIVRMVEGFRNYGCDHYDTETNKITV